MCLVAGIRLVAFDPFGPVIALGRPVNARTRDFVPVWVNERLLTSLAASMSLRSFGSASLSAVVFVTPSSSLSSATFSSMGEGGSVPSPTMVEARVGSSVGSSPWDTLMAVEVKRVQRNDRSERSLIAQAG